MPEIYHILPKELTHVMRHLQKEGTYFLAGTNSVYVPSRKSKYIDATVCKNWPDAEGQIRLMTPGEAARTELVREWPDLNRVGWLPGQIKLLDQRSPMFYGGQTTGKLIYIDLDAAYKQIYEKLWLDTPYPRGFGGQYPLYDVAQRLKDWKVARNSLVGITRSTGMTAYRGTRRFTIKIKNRHLAPGLWATVQSLLHWVAGEAIEYGAIYVNVDGYIFHADPSEFWLSFVNWLSQSGLAWSVRAEGSGEVVSWNNYQIGSFRTKLHRLGLLTNSKEFTNVYPTNERWGQYWSQLSKISSARNV